jgi:lysophospholipase L1-like esterase
MTRRICAETAGATFVETDASLIDEGFFARDGFHPSARGYARWAEIVADAVTERVL